MIQDIKSTASNDPPHNKIDEHVPPQASDAGNSAASVATDPKKPSKFSQVMGTILGGALNVLAPGSGYLIGSLIKGGTGTQFGTMEDMLQRSAQQQMEMLTIQDQMQTQTQTFSAISNLLRARHDAEMVAVNNFRS